MAVLIDDLMDLSGIRRGRLKIAKASVALRSIVDTVVETVSLIFEQRQQELQVELPWPDVHLLADSGRMAQVLTNLLANAAKYTPLGGRVKLVARRLGDEVEIAVHDNGIGLAPQDCERIFQMFAQIDRDLGQRPVGATQEGLGIGLALVKGFVELHGGRVHARSEGIGQGSVFTVTLPALSVQVATPAPLAPAPVGNVAVRRVLIADDNSDAAETLALLLELAGHTTRVVEDGLSAVTACSEFAPQVMLLDISMPGLNGYEVAQRVRANPAHAAVLLVALTGLGFDENREAARRAGFDHHFTKPVDPETVLRVVANA
jgi:CheY-like chemotaxis protein/two-component sensor histidine kinase